MKTFLISDTPIYEIFEYKDGNLYWKIQPTKWINIGDRVGSVRKDGYIETQFKGVSYLLHRLIFFYHYGHWPKLVDHKDQDNTNNRIENLRDSNKRENAYNCGLPSNNTSGIRGVSWCKRSQKWSVRFKRGNKYLFLGNYADIDEAKAVRQHYEKGGI